MVVARNAALDQLREQARTEEPVETSAPEGPAGEADPLLAMIFVTCHPSLQLQSRVALTLKTLCGLDVPEIAAALLASPETIEKRLVRARARLREERIAVALPALAEREQRLESVLSVLYLLFNEGYASLAGEQRVRRELCEEAIRLAGLLVPMKEPRVHALLALMSLHGSRLEARQDGDRLPSLEEQDRGRWDRELMRVGLQHLGASSQGGLTRWHIEAGIAAVHAIAPSFAETDWARIVALYDPLLDHVPGPITALNRAVAVGFADGPAAGLAALDQVPLETGLHAAAVADAHRRLGQRDQARIWYRRALERVQTPPERAFLDRRLAEL